MWRSLLRLTPLALLVSSTSCLNPAEVECDIAVDHLADCCSGFVREGVLCEVASPDITERASDCVQEMSCEELTSRGVCRYFIEERGRELVDSEKVCP